MAASAGTSLRGIKAQRRRTLWEDARNLPNLLTFARILMIPVRYYRARRELAVLGSMTDYELRDIGLTRADLNNVTALPADEDPTLPLAHVVDERRHHNAGRRGL